MQNYKTSVTTSKRKTLSYRGILSLRGSTTSAVRPRQSRMLEKNSDLRLLRRFTPRQSGRLTGNDGNSLHTPSSGFRRNPPLLLEGNKRNDFINKPPLVFPSLGRRGGVGSPLEGSPPKEGAVLPSVRIKNWDDRKITPPVFVPMRWDSATPLKGGGSGIGVAMPQLQGQLGNNIAG